MCIRDSIRGDDVRFRKNGRSVFKEVCPMVVEIITNQLKKLKFNPDDVKRFWLHQANGNMINFIAKKLNLKELDIVSKKDFSQKNKSCFAKKRAREMTWNKCVKETTNAMNKLLKKKLPKFSMS